MKLLHIPQFRAFVFTSILGTFLHFLYDLSGQNPLIALISAINESTWEHMKLLFVPMLLSTVFQRKYYQDRPDYLCIQLKSILLGLILIPALFYTYNGAFGKSPDFVNIGIYFVSAAAAYYYAYKQFAASCQKCNRASALLLLCLLFLAFSIFTFFAPSIPLFANPVM
jgi:hypothetical protein